MPWSEIQRKGDTRSVMHFAPPWRKLYILRYSREYYGWGFFYQDEIFDGFSWKENGRPYKASCY